MIKEIIGNAEPQSFERGYAFLIYVIIDYVKSKPVRQQWPLISILYISTLKVIKDFRESLILKKVLKESLLD